VLGCFSDMLKAVEQHPAMCFSSTISNRSGRIRRPGKTASAALTKNLAREIMSCIRWASVAVTRKRCAITGAHHHRLELCRPRRSSRSALATLFSNAERHEPGAQTLLRKTYEDIGLAQAKRHWRICTPGPRQAKFVATNSHGISWRTIHRPALVSGWRTVR